MEELDPFIADSKEARLAQVLGEFLDRRCRGEPVSEVGLLAAHPDLAMEIKEQLSAVRAVQASDHRVEALITQGLLEPCDEPGFPARLGPYKVSEVIGRGGMGVVLKALDPALNRTIVLKILRPEFFNEARALQRFEREAKAAGSLQHPNIITVFAVGEHRGTRYLAMEYVQGPTLCQLIRKDGPLAHDVAHGLFLQLLSGLAASHGIGLIHRDIKSANLLIAGSKGRPGEAGDDCRAETADSELFLVLKIADFGLARLVSSQTRMTLPGAQLGTPEYMSPEQARGDQEIDIRSDLYSAGVVLYEMTTGKTPFEAESPSAVVHRILHDDVTDPRSITRDADRVLASIALRLLAKKPADRFATAADVIKATRTGRRVQLIAERRVLIHQMTSRSVLVIVSLMLLGGAYLFGLRGESDGSGSTIFSAAGDANLVVVRTEEDPNGRVFYAFPLGHSVQSADVVRLLDKRQRLVVAGITPPQNGFGLFAIGDDKKIAWKTNLMCERKWPDSDRLSGWACEAVFAVNIDHVPGDEVVVAAHDQHYYPSRLSILQARSDSANVTATLWHPGQLRSVARIEPDFFGADRHGLIIVGTNNRLYSAATGTTRPDGPRESTGTNAVCMVMIVDLERLLAEGEGSAPPYVGPRGVARSEAISAYAHLDLPSSGIESPESPDVSTEWATINGLGPAADPVTDGSAPWFFVEIRSSDPQGSATIIVDRDLAIRRCVSSSSAHSREYWEAHWQRIILRGRYTG